MLDRTLKKFIEEYVNSNLEEDFILKNEMLYKKDYSNGLLSGFYFERSSSNKNGFYLSVFVQPLYLRFDSIILTFGHRIKTSENKDFWEYKNLDNIISELFLLSLYDSIKSGLLFLNQVKTPYEFCNFFKIHKDRAVNIHQAITYSLFYLNDKEAYNEARLLLSHIIQTQNIEFGWVKKMVEETELLLSMDIKKVKELLKEWENITIRNLKI